MGDGDVSRSAIRLAEIAVTIREDLMDHTKVIGYLAEAACHVETLQAANHNWQEAYGPLIQETIKVHLKARRIGGQED
jgi:hypothetical protein